MNYMNLLRSGNSFNNRLEDDEQRQKIRQILEQSYNKDTGFNSSVSSLGVNPYQWTLSHQQDYEPTVPRLDTGAFLSRLYGNRSERTFYDTITKPRYQYASYDSDNKPNIPIDSDFFTNKDIYDTEGLLKANNVKLPEKKTEKEDKPSWFIRLMNKISTLDNVWSNAKYNIADGDKNTGILNGIKDAVNGSWNNDDSKIKTGKDFTIMMKEKRKAAGLNPDDFHTLPVRWALKGTKALNKILYKDNPSELDKQNKTVENAANTISGLAEDIIYNPFSYLDLPIGSLIKGNKVQKGAKATIKNTEGFQKSIKEIAPLMDEMGDVFNTAKETEEILDRVNDFNKVAKEGEGGVRWFGKTIIGEQAVRDFADKLPHTKALNKLGEGYSNLSGKSKVLTQLNDTAHGIGYSVRKKFTPADLIDLARQNPDDAARVMLYQDYRKTAENFKKLQEYDAQKKVEAALKYISKNDLDINGMHQDIEKIANPVKEQLDRDSYKKIYDETRNELVERLTEKQKELAELKNIKDFKNPSYSNLEQEVAKLNDAIKEIEKHGDYTIAEDLTRETLDSIKQKALDYNSSINYLENIINKSEIKNSAKEQNINNVLNNLLISKENNSAFKNSNVNDIVNSIKNDRFMDNLIDSKNVNPMFNKNTVQNIKGNNIDSNKILEQLLGGNTDKFNSNSIIKNITSQQSKQNIPDNILDTLYNREFSGNSMDKVNNFYKDSKRAFKNKELLDKSNAIPNITQVDKQMIDTLWNVMDNKTKKIVDGKALYEFPKNYNKELFVKDIENIKKYYLERGWDFSIQDLIGFNPLGKGEINPHAIENIRNKSFELRYPTLSKWKTYVHDNLTGRKFGLYDVKTGGKALDGSDVKVDGIMSDVRKEMWKIQQIAKNKNWSKEQLDSVLKEYSISKVRDIERTMGETPEILEQIYYNSGKVSASANKEKAIRELTKQGLDNGYERDIKSEVANFLNQNKGSETWRNILKNLDKESTKGKGRVLTNVIRDEEVVADLTKKSKGVIDYIKKYHNVDLTDSLGKTIKYDWQLDNVLKYFRNPKSLGDKSYNFTKNIVDDAMETNTAVNKIFDIIKDAPEKVRDKNSISNVLELDNITRLTNKKQPEALKLIHTFINDKDSLPNETINFLEREIKKYGYGSKELSNSIEKFLSGAKDTTKQSDIPKVLDNVIQFKKKDKFNILDITGESKLDNIFKKNKYNIPNEQLKDILDIPQQMKNTIDNKTPKNVLNKIPDILDMDNKNINFKSEGDYKELLNDLNKNRLSKTSSGKDVSEALNLKDSINKEFLSNKNLNIPKDKVKDMYTEPIPHLLEQIANANDTVSDLGKRDSNRINKLLNKLGIDTENINTQTLGVTKENIQHFERVLNQATTEAPKPIGKTAQKNITELLSKTGLDKHYDINNIDINRKNYKEWKDTLNEIATNKEGITIVDNQGKAMPKFVTQVDQLDNPNAFLDVIKKDNKEAYDNIIRAQKETGLHQNTIITPTKAQEIVEARIQNRKDYLNKIEKVIASPETKEDIQRVSKEITGISNSIDDFDNYFKQVVKDDSIVIKTKKVYEQLSIDKKLENIPEEHREIVKMFMEDMEKFGKEEVKAGLLSQEQFEAMVNNYVPHVIHSDFKKQYEKLSEGTKNIISGILENNTPSFAKSRKYTKDIDSFNKYIEELTHGEVKHFFETNLARIYLQRAYQHADAMYDKRITEGTLKLFGTQMEHFTSGENVRLGLKNLNSLLSRQQVEDINNIIKNNKISKNDYSEFYKILRAENPGKNVKEVAEELSYVIDEKELKTVIDKINRNDYDNVVDKILTINKYRNYINSIEPSYDGIFRPSSMSPGEVGTIKNSIRKSVNEDVKFADNKELRETFSKIKSGKFKDDIDKANSHLKMSNYLKEIEMAANNKYGSIWKALENEGKIGLFKEDTYKEIKKLVDDGASAYDTMPKKVQKALYNGSDELISHDTEMLRKINSGEFVLVYPEGQEKAKRIREISGESLANNFGRNIKQNADKGIQFSGMVKINPSDINFKTIMDKNVPVYAIPKEIHEMVEATAKQQFVHDQNALLNLMDRFQTLWKQNALLSVGFHTRNAIGNTFQNFLDIGARVLEPELNAKAFKVLTSNKLDDVITINGHNYTVGEFKKIAQTSGALDIENELREGAREFKKGTVESIGNSTKLINKLNPMDSENFALYKASNKLGGTIEGHARLVNFIAHMEDGKSARAAANLTNKFLFDYSDLTPFEKNFMKRAVPFYTWLRKNIPLQMEMLLNHQTPLKMAEKFRKNISKPMDKEDEKYKPDFLGGWINLGKTKEGKYRFLDMSLPYQDLEKITDTKDLISGLNPLAKVAIEQWANKDMYFGTPIQDRKNQLSEAPLAAKPFYKLLGGDKDKDGKKYIPVRTAHLMRSIMPSLNTVDRMTKKVQKDANMGIKAIMGAKYYELDTEMSKKREKKEYLQELYDIIKNERQLGRYEKPEKEKKEKKDKEVLTSKEKNKYLQLLFQKSKKR